jgi:ATP-dependent Clp protease ATP-binding subunit ClpB
VDFKNTIVIMTSNLGSPVIQEFYGPDKSGASVKDEAELERVVKMELKAHFRPEFLNRVDDIIIFHSLREAELGRIVDIQLERLGKRLAQQQLTLDVDKAAKKLLAKEGYDPQFGARPLKRAIQEHLLDPLATKLLEGEFRPGERIKVGAHDGELVFEKK